MSTEGYYEGEIERLAAELDSLKADNEEHRLTAGKNRDSCIRLESERDEARADRDVYKRVLTAIEQHLKTGAVDEFAAQKSTTFASVVELRAEKQQRDEEDAEAARILGDALKPEDFGRYVSRVELAERERDEARAQLDAIWRTLSRFGIGHGRTVNGLEQALGAALHGEAELRAEVEKLKADNAALLREVTCWATFGETRDYDCPHIPCPACLIRSKPHPGEGWVSPERAVAALREAIAALEEP